MLRDTPPLIAHVGSLGTYEPLSRLSNLNLCIANLAAVDSQYAQYFRLRRSCAWTILDSGVFELFLGTETREVNDAALLDIALSLNVNEVVCPDAPDDPRRSHLRTLAFIERWRTVNPRKRPCLLVVPHGRTVVEWLGNAHRLILAHPRSTVGIPRILPDCCAPEDPQFRVGLAGVLQQAYPQISIHLLGANATFLQEYVCMSKHSAVRSIDTTFILRHATRRIQIGGGYAPPVQLSCDATPPGFQAMAGATVRSLAGYLQEATR